jgi:hypothetical protein
LSKPKGCLFRFGVYTDLVDAGNDTPEFIESFINAAIEVLEKVDV